jgi:hypothetical protein
MRDPRFLSRIPDLGSNNKKRRGKKFVVLPVFVAINFTKFKIISLLNRVLRSIFYPKYG